MVVGEDSPKGGGTWREADSNRRPTGYEPLLASTERTAHTRRSVREVSPQRNRYPATRRPPSNRGARGRARFADCGEIVDGVARVPLTGGGFVVVDADDAERVLAHSWSRHGRYARAGIDGRRRYLHRWLLGVPDGVLVDHANADTNDCRRANLRVVGYHENSWNSSSQRGSSSRYKGIWRRKGRGPWYAEIVANGVRHRLGAFSTELAAARAYDRAARKLHGEFCRPNFPEEAAS